MNTIDISPLLIKALYEAILKYYKEDGNERTEQEEPVLDKQV